MAAQESTYRVVIASVLSAALFSGAMAIGIAPRDTPLSTILPTMRAYIDEHPDDADGYYRLGRLYGLTITLDSDVVAVWPDDRNEPVALSWQKREMRSRSQEEKMKQAEPNETERIERLEQAVMLLNKAIELDARQARYYLALASVLEVGTSYIGKVNAHPGAIPRESLKGESSVANYETWLERTPVAQWSEKFGDRIRMTQSENGMSSARDILVSLLIEMRKEHGSETHASVHQLLALDWREQITENYYEAMCLALPDDSREAEKPVVGSIEEWCSYEAAAAYVRIVRAREPRPDEKMRLATAELVQERIKNLPNPEAITPILVGFGNEASVNDLIAPDATTCFDLDGTARGITWPWVRPTTGILVWDPRGEGHITSGAQLFGSVTWWTFFKNGFQALDALDSDRDGDLVGGELHGLAVWFDTDGNGVSDPGEVVSIEKFGVVSISTRITGWERGAPNNMGGVILGDGAALPIFDWTTDAIDTASTRSFLTEDMR